MEINMCLYSHNCHIISFSHLLLLSPYSSCLMTWHFWSIQSCTDYMDSFPYSNFNWHKPSRSLLIFHLHPIWLSGQRKKNDCTGPLHRETGAVSSLMWITYMLLCSAELFSMYSHPPRKKGIGKIFSIPLEKAEVQNNFLRIKLHFCIPGSIWVYFFNFTIIPNLQKNYDFLSDLNKMKRVAPLASHTLKVSI